jgi:hypothetical protein
VLVRGAAWDHIDSPFCGTNISKLGVQNITLLPLSFELGVYLWALESEL